MKDEIYLGTVCLEPNRWKKTEAPLIRVSDWLDRIQAAGFDGIELWEDHWYKATEEERKLIADSPVPVKIFNTYADGSPSSAARRAAVLETVRTLGCEGIKFNYAKAPSDRENEIETMNAWLEQFPSGFRLLCELHKGACVSIDDYAHARDVLGDAKAPVRTIVHAFTNGSNDFLYRYSRFMGDRLTHIHSARIRESGVNGAEVVKELRELGFAGTWTIEFTTGVAEANEDTELLFTNACRDMTVLRTWL